MNKYISNHLPKFLLIALFILCASYNTAHADMPCEDGETQNCLVAKNYADKGYLYFLNKNYDKAIEAWKIGADNNEAHAQYLLAQVYRDGKLAPQNMRRAVSLLEAAADNNLAVAQQVLANMYYLGKDVRRDLRLAFDYHKKAAENGLLESQFNLAQMYAKGVGTEKNVEEAIRWFKLPASKGNIDALVELGDLYQELDSTNPKNLQQAALYYRLAAEKRNKEAQFKLAKILFNGDPEGIEEKGVRQDKIEAYKWASLSVDKGGNRGPMDLFDRIKQTLMPEQVAEGDQKIIKWRQQKQMEDLLEEEKKTRKE